MRAGISLSSLSLLGNWESLVEVRCEGQERPVITSCVRMSPRSLSLKLRKARFFYVLGVPPSIPDSKAQLAFFLSFSFFYACVLTSSDAPHPVYWAPPPHGPVQHETRTTAGGGGREGQPETLWR